MGASPHQPYIVRFTVFSMSVSIPALRLGGG
jgi:hypothetical protein